MNIEQPGDGHGYKFRTKEHFGLFAKSIYEKAVLRARGFIIFDLDDFK